MTSLQETSLKLENILQKVLHDFNYSIDAIQRQSFKFHNDNRNIESINTKQPLVPTKPSEFPSSLKSNVRRRCRILSESHPQMIDTQQDSVSMNLNPQTPLHAVIDKMSERLKCSRKPYKLVFESRKYAAKSVRDIINTTSGASSLCVDSRVLIAAMDCKTTHPDEIVSHDKVVENPIDLEHQRVVSLQLENKRKRHTDDAGKAFVLPGLVGTKVGLQQNPLKGILLTSEYRDTFAASRRNLLEAIRQATPTAHGIEKNDISVWRDVCISHRQCIYTPSTSMHCKPKKKK